MPITFMSSGYAGTDPTEVDLSRTANYTPQGSTASVQLRFPSAEVADALEDLLGLNNPWPYTTESPVDLYAVTASVKPEAHKATQDGEGMTYPFSVVTVNYSSLNVTGEVGAITLYDEQLAPTAEFVTLDPTDFQWSASPGVDPLTDAEAPGKLIIGLDYILTMYNIATIPAHVLTHPGKVNSGSVSSTSLGLSFAAETLLYNPPVVSRTVSIGGSNRYTIQYRFSYRAQTWNQYWRSKTGAFAQVKKKADGSDYDSYATASFSGIVP